MIECPDHYLYTLNHGWLDIEDQDRQIARLGITEYLQEEMPEILSIELPMAGDELEIEAPCIHFHLDGDDVLHFAAPLTGHVVDINRDVLDNPDLLHLAPYKHWILRIEFDDPAELEVLISARRYTAFCETL